MHFSPDFAALEALKEEALNKEALNEAPGTDPEAASETSGNSTAHPQASRSELLSGEFISHVLTVGVTSSCDHLKQMLTTAIAGKGDVYFAEALARARGSAQRFLGWSKQHPLQAACALTTAFGVAAVALAVVQNHRQGSLEAAGNTDPLHLSVVSVESLPCASEADVASNG